MFESSSMTEKAWTLGSVQTMKTSTWTGREFDSFFMKWTLTHLACAVLVVCGGCITFHWKPLPGKSFLPLHPGFFLLISINCFFIFFCRLLVWFSSHLLLFFSVLSLSFSFPQFPLWLHKIPFQYFSPHYTWFNEYNVEYMQMFYAKSKQGSCNSSRAPWHLSGSGVQMTSKNLWNHSCKLPIWLGLGY